jgi:DNA-binding NarL/FixJ family response regulator
VVIGDRDPFIVRGLESILAAETGFDVVATCLDGIACMKSIRDSSPDLALLCVSLPSISGVQILELINSEQLRTRVVFTALPIEDASGMSALAADAYEIIPPDATPELLIRCLWKVASGERLPPVATGDLGSLRNRGHDSPDTSGPLPGVLTECEQQIVRLLGEGLSSEQIARQLYLSESAIKVQLNRIYQKLAMHNQAVLAETARLRLNGPEPSSA